MVTSRAQGQLGMGRAYRSGREARHRGYAVSSPPIPLSTLWRGGMSAHVRVDVPRACARGQCHRKRSPTFASHRAKLSSSQRLRINPFRPLSRSVPLPAPCSPLPLRLHAPFVPLPNRREVNHLSLHRRVADLRQCDGDHHEVVAALLHPATVRPATTGRPEARLLRGAALRACHGCEVRSGHATRKSPYGIELSPVWLKCNSFTNDPSQVAVLLIRYVSRSLGGRG